MLKNVYKEMFDVEWNGMNVQCYGLWHLCGQWKCAFMDMSLQMSLFVNEMIFQAFDLILLV